MSEIIKKEQLDSLLEMTSNIVIQTCDICPYVGLCKFSEKYTKFHETIKEYMKNCELDPGCVSISVTCRCLKALNTSFRNV